MLIRRAEVADIPAMFGCAQAGFEGYRAFAPPDWTPPQDDTPDNRERFTRELDDPRVFARIAEVDGAYAGHVMVVPGERPSRDGTVPDLHFRHLFVPEPFWGTGVAVALHDAAVEWMRGVVRLYTPALHARARRFYEREGWTLYDGPFHEERFGMELVEYRR